ncbi:MAG: NAD(P)-dependent dehydrogenase (short-subunit alcohol dehydrogenase family) [Paracoccaceae bacterium]|jgi:NAD(P)-dependent dehydrogenase (short-subunit alcohol dehydrogenase family)
MTPNHPTGGVAFVTGGGGGIGGATAERLASNGVSVAIADYDFDRADDVRDRIVTAGGTAQAIKLDVTDPASVTRAIAEADSTLGPIDQLVNTAGIFGWAAMEDISDADFENMFRIHVFGMHSVCRGVIPGMVARGAGAVVNVTSIHAIRGQSLTAHYSAAKGAILSYTKALAREKSPLSIRINAVAPGPIDTPLWRGDMDENEVAEKMAGRTGVIPMARLGTVDEVAAGITFLLSPAASYLTGHIMTIDGGEVMN